MAGRCRAEEALDNPGVELGVALAVAAGRGRDKLTLVLAPPIAALGVWLEQLIAESTGKQGRMILPIEARRRSHRRPTARTGCSSPSGLAGELAGGDEERIEALVAAGQPVLELDCAAVEELGAEMFRWEIATAVAGARLRDPPVRPARRRGRQGRGPAADCHDRGAGRAARRVAVRLGNGARALRRHRPAARAPGWRRTGCDRRLPPRPLRSGRGGRLPGTAGLSRHERAERGGARGAADVRGPGRGRDDRRFRSAFPALHRPGAQGRPGGGVFLQITEQPLEDLAVPGQSLTFRAGGRSPGGLCDLEVLATRGRRHPPAPFPGRSGRRLGGAWRSSPSAADPRGDCSAAAAGLSQAV
ncbi:MAG: hypothetical protein R2862_08875 [Thermoanaerobaculia bacterium]